VSCDREPEKKLYVLKCLEKAKVEAQTLYKYMEVLRALCSKR
jgi:hypothetical protein